MYEDNSSIRSEDSNDSLSAQKEKLESLINLELKHSGVYYDLHSKNSLLKVDLENLNNSCHRFESKKKKKSELLEVRYDKLREFERNNYDQLIKILSSTTQKLEEVNMFFCKAFDDYSSKVLRNSAEYFNNETGKLEKDFTNMTDKLNSLRIKGRITESLMKPKIKKVTDIENVRNMLFEKSMKRPEIKLEETASKLTDEIKKLEQKLQELKSSFKKTR